MSNQAAYNRYLKSLVRQSVDLSKLGSVPVSPTWVLELTDTILRDRQKQFLDASGEPPPNLVTKIAGQLLKEFREISDTLKTGDIKKGKVGTLLSSNDIREKRRETKFKKSVSRLVDRGIPSEAAKEKIREDNTKKIRNIVSILPPDDTGAIPIPGASLTFSELISPKIDLTPGGIGHWLAYDIAKPFVDQRKDAGEPFNRIIIRLGDGTEKIISGNRMGTVKKILDRITQGLNEYNSNARGGDADGGGGGSAGSAYGELEMSEDNDDLILSLNTPEDFDFEF